MHYRQLRKPAHSRTRFASLWGIRQEIRTTLQAAIGVPSQAMNKFQKVYIYLRLGTTVFNNK